MRCSHLSMGVFVHLLCMGPAHPTNLLQYLAIKPRDGKTCVYAQDCCIFSHFPLATICISWPCRDWCQVHPGSFCFLLLNVFQTSRQIAEQNLSPKTSTAVFGMAGRQQEVESECLKVPCRPPADPLGHICPLIGLM